MRPADPNKPLPAPAEPETSGGLFSHFVRRTDNDFHGVEDKSLLGEDIGFEDEDGENEDRDEIDRPA